MSAHGIAEFQRLYAEARQRIPYLPEANVTDDLRGVTVTGGTAGATAQVNAIEPDGRIRIRITPDPAFVPSRPLVWHETGHVAQSLLAPRLEPVYPLLDIRGEATRAAHAARGSAPTGTLGYEQMASMLPEAFIGEWGGYPHPLYGTDPNTVRDKVAAWYATPAAAAMRRWWWALPQWAPPVETRIASFWQLVNTLPAEAVLNARDIHAWATNVLDRDPAAKILAGDFKRVTADMQRAIDRARTA